MSIGNITEVCPRQFCGQPLQLRKKLSGGPFEQVEDAWHLYCPDCNYSGPVSQGLYIKIASLPQLELWPEEGSK